MRRSPPRSKPEPTIALINIVFLMLIFFMVAGTLSPPIDPDVTLVNTRDLEGREPNFALVITAEGGLRYRGQEVADVQPYLRDLTFDDDDGGNVARILPDRDAPAPILLQVARDLRAGGAERVLIVTEKALQ
ncbi:MAG: biopolymer transporter ExbD [Pseudomonadota bacterium]